MLPVVVLGMLLGTGAAVLYLLRDADPTIDYLLRIVLPTLLVVLLVAGFAKRRRSPRVRLAASIGTLLAGAWVVHTGPLGLLPLGMAAGAAAGALVGSMMVNDGRLRMASLGGAGVGAAATAGLVDLLRRWDPALPLDRAWTLAVLAGAVLALLVADLLAPAP